MKKMFLLCLALVFAVFAAQAQGFFVIEGKIDNAPKDAVVYLFKTEGTVGTFVSSDSLADGRFRLEGKTKGDLVENMFLVASYDGVNSMMLDLWLRSGSHVKITSDNMLAYTWHVESDVPEQQTRQKIIAPVRDLWDEMQLNNLQEDAIRAKQQDENLSETEKDKLKAASDSLRKANEFIRERIVAGEAKVLASLEVDAAWMDAFTGDVSLADMSDSQQTKDCMKALYDKLPERWKNTPKGVEARLVIYPPKQVGKGDVVADGDLFGLDGKVHHLADFRGKYVLLDFWSVGCAPCKAAIPELKELAEAYEDSLEVVSLSLDTERIWHDYSAKEGMTWHNLNDMQGFNGIAARFGVGVVPLFVLVSPQGTLVEKWSGYVKGDLKARIEKLL